MLSDVSLVHLVPGSWETVLMSLEIYSLVAAEWPVDRGLSDHLGQAGPHAYPELRVSE